MQCYIQYKINGVQINMIIEILYNKISKNACQVVQRHRQTLECLGIRLYCPTISSLLSYKNGVQVIKVYSYIVIIRYFLQHKEAAILDGLIDFYHRHCAKMQPDKSGDTVI